MRVTGIVGISLIGLLVFLGACGSPAAKAPDAPSPIVTALAAPPPVAASPTVSAPVVAAPKPAAAAPAVPAPTPVPGKTPFVLSNLIADPDAVMQGDNVTVSVDVKNTGAQRETYTIALQFNGDTVKTQAVTLDSGSSRKVELNLTADTIGEYKVTIDQLTTKLLVMACP